MIFNLLLQYVLELFFKICVCVLFLVFVFLIFCCVHFLVCVFLLLCLNNWFCVLHFKVKALTCSMTQILTSKRCYKDFDKGNGFCGAFVMFCSLYELFWKMLLLFWKCLFWSEKCTEATEKHCRFFLHQNHFLKHILTRFTLTCPFWKSNAAFEYEHSPTVDMQFSTKWYWMLQWRDCISTGM